MNYIKHMDKFQYQVLFFKMNKEEAFALRLALIYLELSHKFFPEYYQHGLPKKGDPRKCELFKYCWKLMNDMKGKLQPEEYRLYILAQLSILKNIKIKDHNLFYGPRCLVNKPAWNRWLIWKKYFNETKKRSEILITEKIDLNEEIKKDLQNTHYALTLRLGALTKEKIGEEIHFVMRLYRMNVISPYFLALSSTVQNYDINFDKELYKVNDEIVKYFKKLFGDI